MKPKDIFKLATKILGLIFLYNGLATVPNILPFLFSKIDKESVFALMMALWPLLVAYWLLSGAPQLMRIAYKDMED